MVQRCPVCNGTGKQADYGAYNEYDVMYSNCETCKGVGSYEDADPPDTIHTYLTCPACKEYVELVRQNGEFALKDLPLVVNGKVRESK